DDIVRAGRVRRGQPEHRLDAIARARTSGRLDRGHGVRLDARPVWGVRAGEPAAQARSGSAGGFGTVSARTGSRPASGQRYSTRSSSPSSDRTSTRNIGPTPSTLTGVMRSYMRSDLLQR